MSANRLTLGSSAVFVFFLVVVFGVSFFPSPTAVAQDSPVPIYEIDGFVLKSGEHLPEATVTLKKDGQVVATKTTDSNGAYAFTQVAAGAYVVAGSHTCCYKNTVSVSVGGTQLKVQAPDLVLREKEPLQSENLVTLSGFAKDQKTGQKLANVSIEIDNYWSGSNPPPQHCGGDVCTMTVATPVPNGYQHFSFMTGGDGSFEVEINRGSVNLYAHLDAYDRTHGSFEVPQNLTKDVPMWKADDNRVRLHGVVTGSDGQKIKGASVSVSPDYYSGCPPNADCVAPLFYERSGCENEWCHESLYSRYNSTETGPDGSWELTTQSGRLLVQAWAQDYLDGRKQLDAPAGADLQVDFSLERIPPDSVHVKGHVVDRETGDLLRGASINVENQKWGTYAWGQTDENGRFDVLTKPGYSILSVSYYAYCMPPTPVVYAEAQEEPQSTTTTPSTASPEPVQTASPSPPVACSAPDRTYFTAYRSFDAAEGETVQFEIQLVSRPAPDAEFKGYVLDASTGKGILGAMVTFHNEATYEWGSATTDADGSYKINVHGGYYSVRVWKEAYFDGVANAEINDHQTKRLDFQLTPGQKRYGHYYGWAPGAYAVREQSASPGAPPSSDAQGPPIPAQGDQRYEGGPGGLGPFHPADVEGGNAPAPLFPLATLALVGLVILLRRRK